jgi:hypothetical protein
VEDLCPVEEVEVVLLRQVARLLELLLPVRQVAELQLVLPEVVVEAKKILVLGPIRHQAPYLRVLEVEGHPLLAAAARLEVAGGEGEAVELGRLP